MFRVVLDTNIVASACLTSEGPRLSECAKEAEADFLVTGNQKHFPKSFGQARVVAPREFLTELGF